MNFKHSILSSIWWRGLYFISAFLLNIIVSRYLQAEGSGRIFYIINYFSFILLIAGLNLETGMAFYAAKNSITKKSLASASVLWSIIASVLILGWMLLNIGQPSQELTKKEFIFYTATYIPGILLNTFFCALFYAQEIFSLPNLILTITNLLLIIATFFIGYFAKNQYAPQIFLNLYFFNFLLQGILLFTAYTVKNNIFLKWSLPGLYAVKMMLRYSLTALFANIVFFLLYRIDYWFIKNVCISCGANELGNYIQVSKLGQVFLLLPTFIASAIFPRTAAGFKEQVNSWLPVLVKTIIILEMIAFLFLLITGKWLFPWIYGKTFNHMYSAFVLLVPGIFSLSVVALISAYNAGKNKVSTNLKGALTGLIIVLAGDWLLVPHYGIKAAAAVSSVGYTGYFVYVIIVFKNEYQISLKNFFVPAANDLQKLKQMFTGHEEN